MLGVWTSTPDRRCEYRDFIRRELDAHERDGAIIGISGGIDSSVVGTLLVRALAPERVLAVVLPERDSDPRSTADARREIDRLGVAHREIDLTPALDALGVYDLLHLDVLPGRRVKESLVAWQHRRHTGEGGETPFRSGLVGTHGLGKNRRSSTEASPTRAFKPRLRMLVLYYVAEQENRLVVGTTNRSDT